MNGTLQKSWLYQDQLKPEAELNPDGSIRMRFVYGTKVNVPEYLVTPVDGKTYRVVTDHLGSVRLVVDLSTGLPVERIDYDEFGRVIADTNPGFQPFGFAGGLWDADTGLVRFGVRDYDPETGRFAARDSASANTIDAINLYNYTLGNPINYFDPSGRVSFTQDAGVSIGAGLGAGASLSAGTGGLSGNVGAGFGFGLGGFLGWSANFGGNDSPCPCSGAFASASGGALLGGAVTVTYGNCGFGLSITGGLGLGAGFSAGGYTSGTIVSAQ